MFHKIRLHVYCLIALTFAGFWIAEDLAYKQVSLTVQVAQTSALLRYLHGMSSA